VEYPEDSDQKQAGANDNQKKAAEIPESPQSSGE